MPDPVRQAELDRPPPGPEPAGEQLRLVAFQRVAAPAADLRLEARVHVGLQVVEQAPRPPGPPAGNGSRIALRAPAVWTRSLDPVPADRLVEAEAGGDDAIDPTIVLSSDRRSLSAAVASQ